MSAWRQDLCSNPQWMGFQLCLQLVRLQPNVKSSRQLGTLLVSMNNLYRAMRPSASEGKSLQSLPIISNIWICFLKFEAHSVWNQRRDEPSSPTRGGKPAHEWDCELRQRCLYLLRSSDDMSLEGMVWRRERSWESVNNNEVEMSWQEYAGS